MIVASLPGFVALGVFLVVIVVALPTWALTVELGFRRALVVSLGIAMVACAVTAAIVGFTFWAAS